VGRFKLMGYQVTGAEANPSTVTLEQQHAEHTSTIVLETDDQVEARAIVEAGGFFRDRDNFITVTSVVDSEDTEQRDQPSGAFFRPSTFPQKGN
jgi:hypothetical protein